MSNFSNTVSAAVANVVADRSDIVFGIMGNGNAYFVSHLTANAKHYVSARHESGAVAMAQGYHLASGRVGTVTTTYGPGYTNIMTALAEAKLARIPMVVVVGDAPTAGRRAFDIDQTMAARAVGVRTVRVGLDDVVAQTQHAFDVAEYERMPVIVAIPYDLAAADIERQTEPRPLEKISVPDVNEDALAQVADALAKAKRPLIIGGRGAFLSDAGAMLREVGDKVGALFATSVLARNMFASPWDLGIAGGFATLGAASKMRAADVVLVVGSSLNDFQMRYGTLLESMEVLIQVDVLPAATNAAVTQFIQADGPEFAEGLNKLVTAREGTTWRDLVPEVANGDIHLPDDRSEYGPDSRLNPRAVAIELSRMLPEERTIVQDGGHFIGWMNMYCAVPDPHALMLPGLAFHGIGLGFPAAVGAGHGRPDRLTVLVTGDGGGVMALPDLETMIRTLKSAVVVVFNDAAYGMEVHQYGVRGLDTTAMLFDEVNFAAVAQALGGHGLNVRNLSDLQKLSEWLNDGAQGVMVVDIAVSREIVAEYVTESLAAAK